eukprot:2687330-Amphidinium_carterae.3
MAREDFAVQKDRPWNHEPVTQPVGYSEFNNYDDTQKTDFVRGFLTQSMPNQAAAKLEALINLHPRALESAQGVVLPPENPQDKYGTNKNIRSIPIGRLHGIKGCVGPVRPTSLILLAPEDSRPTDDDDGILWDETYVATHRIVIRSTPSVMSPAIGIHEPGLMVRLIGNPRTIDSTNTLTKCVCHIL